MSKNLEVIVQETLWPRRCPNTRPFWVFASYRLRPPRLLGEGCLPNLPNPPHQTSPLRKPRSSSASRPSCTWLRSAPGSSSPKRRSCAACGGAKARGRPSARSAAASCSASGGGPWVGGAGVQGGSFGGRFVRLGLVCSTNHGPQSGAGGASPMLFVWGLVYYTTRNGSSQSGRVLCLYNKKEHFGCGFP